MIDTVCRVYRKEWVRGGEVRGGDKLKFSGVVDTLSAPTNLRVYGKEKTKKGKFRV